MARPRSGRSARRRIDSERLILNPRRHLIRAIGMGLIATTSAWAQQQAPSDEDLVLPPVDVQAQRRFGEYRLLNSDLFKVPGELANTDLRTVNISVTRPQRDSEESIVANNLDAVLKWSLWGFKSTLTTGFEISYQTFDITRWTQPATTTNLFDPNPFRPLPPGQRVLAAKSDSDGFGWVDGKITAGHQSAWAKDNLQIPEGSPEAREMGEMIGKALEQISLFVLAALPTRIFPPLFNRYEPGMTFGAHVDNAIRLIPGTPFACAPISPPPSSSAGPMSRTAASWSSTTPTAPTR